MTYRIPVFKTEREDGVAESVQANASVAYLAPLQSVKKDSPLGQKIVEAARASEQNIQTDFDLYFVRDVMVTTGWNLNKDVFDRYEAWSARHTPLHKPFNMEHRPLHIIGHITETKVIDDAMNEIADDTNLDDLPDKFHIANGSVLYTELADDNYRELIQQTIAEIERGEWYVSMEALFRGFDYGVVRPDGTSGVIARNESTAFLTKHLRQYGGTGNYTDQSTGSVWELGRVLRNITFSGKGLVRDPGNPESVIFNSTRAFASKPVDLGYLSIGSEQCSTEAQESESMPEMSAAEKLLQDRLDKALADMENLKSEGTQKTISELRSEIEKKNTAITQRDQTISELRSEVETANKSVESEKTRADQAEKAKAEAEKAKEEAETVKASVEKRLAEIEGEARTASRRAKLTEKNAPKEAIDRLMESFAGMDDEKFDETIELLSASWKPTETPPPAPQTKPEKPAKSTAAIDQAKTEEEPDLGTNDDSDEESEEVKAFYSRSLASARGYQVVDADEA